MIKIRKYQSPVGELIIGSYKDDICLCDWIESRRRISNDNRLCGCLDARYEEGESDVIIETLRQLDEYFEGKRKKFTIPLIFNGTEFQRRVWSELKNIPYGTTVSYKDLAYRLGNIRAVRAVASAVASNPMSILVPCHRVVGSDGQLTGYAAGICTKQWLLYHESVVSGTFAIWS